MHSDSYTCKNKNIFEYKYKLQEKKDNDEFNLGCKKSNIEENIMNTVEKTCDMIKKVSTKEGKFCKETDFLKENRNTGN